MSTQTNPMSFGTQGSQGSSNFTKKVSNYSKQGVEKYKSSSTMGKVIFFIILENRCC